MKSAWGRELGPCHGPAAESRMGWSVCRESGGNGEGESPGKKWMMRSCDSVRAGWAPMLQSGASWI